jgi:pseudomonalisin
MVGARKQRAVVTVAVMMAIGFAPSAFAHTSATDVPELAASPASRSTDIKPAAQPSGLVALSTDVPHGLTAKAIGAPAASTPMRIGVLLRGRDDAGLSQFDNAVHPSLTPAQFEARFGVEPTREAASLSWLRRAGLTVGTPSTTRYIVADGTAGAVSKLLGVRFVTYRAPDGSSFIANLDAPSVPAALGIVRILGLNGSLKVKPLFERAFPSSESTNPADLWKLYDQPDGTNVADDLGQGQQLATLLWGSKAELEPTVGSDLKTFETQNKLPFTPLTFHYERGYVDPGATSDPNGTGVTEAELDSQASTAMAPAADALTMYFAQSPAIVDLAEAADEWTSDATAASQMSASFGGCETLDLGLEGSGLDTAFQQAEAEGRTVFAPAGDAGAGCEGVNGVNSPLIEAEFPASSPYVVAVGGTVVTEDGHTSPMSEYAWSSGGGGISKYEAQPAWQQGVAPVPAQCVADEGTATWFADGQFAGPHTNPDRPPVSPQPAQGRRAVPGHARRRRPVR